MTDVPTVRVDHLPHSNPRLRDCHKRLAENAGWDREPARPGIPGAIGSAKFRCDGHGFEMGEIDLIVSEASNREQDEADVVRRLTAPPLPCRGLATAGRSATTFSYAEMPSSRKATINLLGGKRAQMVFTDPPYNVRIAGNVSGLGKARHREFAMASGEMSRASSLISSRRALTHLAAFSTNGSLHFVCMDWRHIRELADAADDAYTELKNICVWSKECRTGSLYRSAHEFIFVYKNGHAKHINNVEFGRFGRSRTNIWEYSGMSSFGKDRDETLAGHPTPKPLALVSDAILDCSNEAALSWMHSPAAAPRCSPPRRPDDADTESNSIRIMPI